MMRWELRAYARMLEVSRAALLGALTSTMVLLPTASLAALRPTVADPIEPAAIPTAADGPVYLVSEIVPEFDRSHPDHPSVDEVLDAEVELSELPEGYVAPRAGVRPVTVRLSELRGGPARRYHASALAAVNRAILMVLNGKGIGGVRVQTDPQDIDPTSGEDHRANGHTALRALIQTGRIGQVRIEGARAGEVETVGYGDRVPDEPNNAHRAEHRKILENSPIQATPDVAGGQTDLLNTARLEDYLAQLNRHPGRNVTATVSPSRIEPGVAYLDYRVVEEKPWSIYAQYSKTGTEQTSEWRNRFGFRHTQLTGNDDILRFDYITAGDFQDVHALFGSYEFPLSFISEETRMSFSGVYSEYDASDVGIAVARFTGRQHTGGAEIVQNVFQYKNFFLDLAAGVRWTSVHVENQLARTEGREDYFAPRVALRAEHKTPGLQFNADVGIERSLGGGSALDKKDLVFLGRIDPDDRWMVLRWNASVGAYLEPLLSRMTSAVDRNHRVHEVVLEFRGQEAFDNRLLPHEELTAGGLFSVRGYPQSAIAGDSVAIYRGEYKLHLSRLLGVRSPVEVPGYGDFKVARSREYGSPDWDLIVSAFSDYASVRVSDQRPGEIDDNLWGAGVGIELQLLRNLSLKYSLGFALSEVKDITGNHIQDEGEAEHHLSFTVLY